MLQEYFEKIFLINLESRHDRLQKVTERCGKIGIVFERINAVDGMSFKREFISYEPNINEKMRWNVNAAGLVQTTLNILYEAKDKKYESILILEDDVEFHPLFRQIVTERMKDLPADWETLYFGLSHIKPFAMANRSFGRVTEAYCCHCYAIRNTMYDFMIEKLSGFDKPLDYVTAYDIQPRGKSYCFVPNMAYQEEDFSDIMKINVNHHYLKQQ